MVCPIDYDLGIRMAKLIKLLSKGKEKFEEEMIEEEENNHSNIIQHELLIPEIENQLNNWKIPKIEISSIYKTAWKDMFKTEYIIKTVDKGIDLRESHESIPLITKSLIAEHIKEYRYMHIGAIQVAIKPLHRLGLNTPMFVALRDNRPKKLEN